MLTLNDIKTKIEKADNIVIICHISPDGDTIGSGLALYKFLNNKNKKVELVCEDVVGHKFDILLNGETIIKNDLSDDITFDLAICVDVATAERMGDLRRFFYRAKDRMVIDHHKTNDFDSSCLYLKTDVTSVAEIMYSVLSFVDESCIDKSVAECMYAGILTDSGAFYFPSTTANTHLVLSKLYSYGINANKIYYELFKKTPKNVFELHSTILKNAVFENNSQIAILTFKLEDFEKTNTTIHDTDGCINKVLDVDEVIISISIAEVGENSYKVSFRSKGDVDVSICASRFGGGGHKNAAGCRINGNYYDIFDKVLRIAQTVL